MNQRRDFMVSVGTLAASGLGAGCSTATGALGTTTDTGVCLAFDKSRQADVTPDQALALLREGNERFVNGRLLHCDLMAQVRATATAQAPFAAVVGCIDSRVPPELVFDQRMGCSERDRLALQYECYVPAACYHRVEHQTASAVSVKDT